MTASEHSCSPNLDLADCPVWKSAADPKSTQVFNLPRPKYPQIVGGSRSASAPLSSAFAAH